MPHIVRDILYYAALGVFFLWLFVTLSTPVVADEYQRRPLLLNTQTEGCNLVSDDIRSIRMFIDLLDGKVDPLDYVEKMAETNRGWALSASIIIDKCGPEITRRGESV